MGYALDMLDEATRSAREVTVVLYMLLVGIVELTGNRMRAALRQVRERVEQGQQLEALGVLAGGIAHDFNNLLTIISGQAQLLRRKLEPDTDNSRRIDEIIRAGERGAALIERLQAFSRKESSPDTVVDLGVTVLEMEEMLTRLLGEEIRLTIICPPGSIPILADHGQCEQMIMNLSTNARNAMPTGGELTLTVGSTTFIPGEGEKPKNLAFGSYGVLEIRDTGVGMEPEIMHKIFEPFFTTRPRTRGTGLGLSVVYGIVEKCRGSITVASEPGVGTAIRIYLPRADAGTIPDRAEPAEEVTGMLAGRVLLAEDDEAVREYIAGVLESAGLEVEEAADGAAALEMLRSEPEAIDLIVTDVIMPVMSGPELAGEARELRPDLPILFISGYTDDHPGFRAHQDAIRPLLRKPASPGAILSQVRDLL
jgi:signal transduction histidine kinase